MSVKIDFLRSFFESGKYAEDKSLTGQIADLFPAIIYTCDIESRKLDYMNLQFTEYFGYPDEVIRHTSNAIYNLVHPDDVDLVKHALERLYGDDPEVDTCTYESRLCGREGNCRHFKTNGYVVKDADGRASSLLFIAQDITEAIKSRQEADSLKKLSVETEELLQFGTWTLEVTSNTMTWTPGLCLLLGYPKEEAGASVSKSIYFDHIVNGYRDGLNEIISQAMMAESGFDYEYVVQTRSGVRKTVFTKGKVMMNDQGNVEKILGITRDITAIRNFEKEQERSIRELNRSNKELEEFAYVASHDLQEPLRKISMFSERLKLKLGNALDREGELFIERVMVASANMRMLIDDLLEFSRINRSSHNFNLLALQTVIDQAIADLELKIEETGSTIRISGTLPKVEAVPSEMKQLFNNLLSNAIKFRKNNAPAMVDIVCSKLAREEKKAWQLPAERTFYKIDIRDQGIGFDEEYADKIFLIFQRLHGKTEYPGSGIGLAICKKIVDNHNGIIFAHSEPEKGATFTVILPEKQF